MKYTDIFIKNFRGIRSLELQDCQQVNLMVGRNNCGKTSILEAVFLLSGMSNPQLMMNIHLFRDMILTEEEDFNYPFYHLDARNLIEISATARGAKEKKRMLKITPLYADEISSGEKTLITLNVSRSVNIDSTQTTSLELSGSTATFQLIEGLKFDFSHENGQKAWHTELRFKEHELRFAKDYKEHVRCVFMNPKTMMADLDTRLGHLLVQKNLKKVIAVLQEIEPPIVDIRMGANKMIYVDIGLEKLLPVNIMGDGIRRLLAILAAIANTPKGVVLIDEIENGLHYASLIPLWKAVFRAAQEFDTQIFATTHSYECIEAFAKTEYDDIRFYRIDRKDGKHTAYCATPEVLRAGVEKAFEVR